MAIQNCATVLAPAKLNLALDVVGLLPNGYHNLDMTMQAITLYERVVLRRSQHLSLTLPGSPVAANDSNTAIKAALAFFHYTGLLAGVEITIYKNVPVRAGMAGGSADAAGLPPAKEIMPGLAIILKISRMALPLIWSKRCAKRRESSAIIQSLLYLGYKKHLLRTKSGEGDKMPRYHFRLAANSPQGGTVIPRTL